MADYNVNMKQWNGSSFDNVLPLAYNAKQLGGQSLAEVKQWVQDNGLLLYTGQYTGTGTYGMNNPSSITFPFVPILFFFPVGFKTINTNDLTQDYKSFTIDANRYGSTNVYLKKSDDGKTIYWYSDITSVANVGATIYSFVAIGGYDMGGQTEFLITSSGSWIVPRTGRYVLELYGGGGGTSRAYRENGYTGGASCQHYDSISLTIGESVNIVIGSGVSGNEVGGTTSFGSYSVSGGGSSTKYVAGAGAGNYGAAGKYVNSGTEDYNNYGSGIFSIKYGFGAGIDNDHSGPGAVYLKYLGA